MSRIEEIRERVEKATPGPWEVRYRELDNHEQSKIWAENYGWLVTRGDLPRSYHEPSMKFIAHSREDIPYLIDKIEKLKKALEEIKRHYEHPYHDHNWAYYTNEIVSKTLCAVEKE